MRVLSRCNLLKLVTEARCRQADFFLVMKRDPLAHDFGEFGGDCIITDGEGKFFER